GRTRHRGRGCPRPRRRGRARRGRPVIRRNSRPVRQGERMTSRRGRTERAASAKRRRVAPVALTLPLVLLLGACADNAPQTTLEPEGPFARSIDNLWDGVFAVAAVVFVLVQVGTVAIAM